MTTRLVATVLPADAAAAAGMLLDPPPGADYLELRLDALSSPTPKSVKQLLGLPRSIPVIAACRSETGAAAGTAAGGASGIASGIADADLRLSLLAAAGEAGADLLDVEDGLLPEFPASVPGQRIASCHIARFAPRLDALARRVAGHGARFAKLAVPAQHPRQLAELLALQESLGESFAIVPTGRLSEAGRVMAAARGAALCYGAAQPDRPGHPDQPSCARLHDVFNVQVLGPATRFFAVVGHPIEHSLSPCWHNAVFRGVGQDARLVALDVDRLADVVTAADALRLDGLSVTRPFKQEALDLASTCLPGASSTGAANMLLRLQSPAGWQARNTDWKAACDLLPRLLRGWRKAHPGATPRVLLLGSGGVARAVAVALFGEDVELAIWSRRLSNARALCESLGETLPALAVPDPAHHPADLLVNATPVGSPGCDGGELRITSGNFRPGALAVDLAYGAEASPFRSAAAQAGAHLTRGEDFFCLQARRQSELYTGATIPEELRADAARRCGVPR